MDFYINDVSDVMWDVSNINILFDSVSRDATYQKEMKKLKVSPV